MHSKYTVILGDLNARMQNLNTFCQPSKNISYSQNVDLVSNENGRIAEKHFKTLNLTPVNHMIYKSKHFEGNFTFRKKANWISQLDWAFVSTKLVPNITSFNVLQSHRIPTDHAPITLEINLLHSMKKLLTRAKNLEAEYSLKNNTKQHCKKAIKMDNIDILNFNTILPNPNQLWDDISNQNESIEDINDEICKTLYDSMTNSRKQVLESKYHKATNSHHRWKNILSENDSKKLWTAINWKGKWEGNDSQKSKPSNKQFCEHFELLLNPEETRNQTPYQPQNFKYIPILDDNIQPQEVLECVQKLKTRKAAGPDGIPPGILKQITDEWILVFTHLFNCILNGNYPVAWTEAKVFTIYKKGNPEDPGNYRGISIMSAIAKLYDMVLNQRFNLWYRPNPEQAGSQKNRSCEEQILTVKLLIEIARKTKKSLYITYIDYEKAYDKINRNLLFERLDKLGCGTKFLKALQQSTKSVGYIGNDTFNTSSGVKQGGVTSCSTFVCHIDPTIDAVKSIQDEDWLKDIPILLYMDDTVIFASSREKMAEKLRILKTTTDKIGMKIHPTKSKYQCVNVDDQTSFIVDNISIQHTNKYVYLGAIISNDTIANQTKLHIEQKQPHVMKYHSFLAKKLRRPLFSEEKSLGMCTQVSNSIQPRNMVNE